MQAGALNYRPRDADGLARQADFPVAKQHREARRARFEDVREVLHTLAGALLLIEHNPGDATHREALEVLEVVFHIAAREVSTRATTAPEGDAMTTEIPLTTEETETFAALWERVIEQCHPSSRATMEEERLTLWTAHPRKTRSRAVSLLSSLILSVNTDDPENRGHDLRHQLAELHRTLMPAARRTPVSP